MVITNIKTTYMSVRRQDPVSKMEDKYDITYTLKRVNGKMWLNTWTEKNGSYHSGSTSPIEPDDSLIEELFFGLKFAQIDYDGTPVFEKGDDVIHLVTEHAVNMVDDTYTI